MLVTVRLERRCHHGVLMVDYCPLRLPCSQHAESGMGREAGGAYTYNPFIGVCCFVSFNVAW